MKKGDVQFEKDEITKSGCQECGYADDRDTDGSVCPNCDGEISALETTHGDVDCAGCNHTFDMYESAYKNPKTGDLYCKSCHDGMED